MSYAYIVQTPGICRGKPRIDGTRIKVEMIADWIVHGGQPPVEVQSAHPSLTMAQIHSALAYYYDHRAEVDASLEEGRRSADELRGRFPSPLQEKLRTPEPRQP
jgi:uncharacterized protein (DUF433 family)